MDVRDLILFLILMLLGAGVYFLYQSYKNTRALVLSKEIESHLQDIKELRMVKLNAKSNGDDAFVEAVCDALDDMISEKEAEISDLRHSRRKVK